MHLSGCGALSSYLGCEDVASSFGPSPSLLVADGCHKGRDTSRNSAGNKPQVFGEAHDPLSNFSACTQALGQGPGLVGCTNSAVTHRKLGPTASLPDQPSLGPDGKSSPVSKYCQDKQR